MERISCIVLLGTSPPKIPNNSCDLGSGSLRKENSWHVVNWNGSKNWININKTTSMVEFIGFKHSQLSPELVQNEIISFSSITVIKNNRVAKINFVRSKIRNLTAVLLLLSTFLLNMIEDLAKLGVWPYKLQKFWRIRWILVASWKVARSQIIKSSAKRSEWILGQLGPNITPWILWASDCCCKVIESPFTAIIKR